MPSDYCGDTLLCKQCHVSYMSPSHPPDKTDSALTFLPLSVPDFAYILFPLEPMIGYEHWSHPIHNTKHHSGTAAGTTKEAGSCLREHTSSCVFWVRASFSKCHTRLSSLSLSRNPMIFYCDSLFIIYISTPC